MEMYVRDKSITFVHYNADPYTFKGRLITSGVTAGGTVPPDTCHREISGDLPGKGRQGKKSENSEEKKELREREGRNWKWKEE